MFSLLRRINELNTDLILRVTNRKRVKARVQPKIHDELKPKESRRRRRGSARESKKLTFPLRREEERIPGRAARDKDGKDSLEKKENPFFFLLPRFLLPTLF